MANFNQLNGINLNLTNALVTLPSTNVVSTGATSNGLIGGKFATAVTAVTTQAPLAADVATGLAPTPLLNNQATVIVFGILGTGVGGIRTAQGSIVNTEVGVGNVAGNFISAPQFPVMPDNFLPLAYALVRSAPSAASWQGNSGNWAATGITTSAVVNLGQLPDRPSIS